MEGRVKSANSRGFGFIETLEQIDFFLHYTQFQGDWKELLTHCVSGRMVIVEFDNNPDSTRGPQALNVKIKEVKDD